MRGANVAASCQHWKLITIAPTHTLPCRTALWTWCSCLAPLIAKSERQRNDPYFVNHIPNAKATAISSTIFGHNGDFQPFRVLRDCQSSNIVTGSIDSLFILTEKNAWYRLPQTNKSTAQSEVTPLVLVQNITVNTHKTTHFRQLPQNYSTTDNHKPSHKLTFPFSSCAADGAAASPFSSATATLSPLTSLSLFASRIRVF